MDLLTLIVLVLLVLWLVGVVAVPVTGGFIHVLLAIVLVLVIVRLAQNRRID